MKTYQKYLNFAKYLKKTFCFLLWFNWSRSKFKTLLSYQLKTSTLKKSWKRLRVKNQHFYCFCLTHYSVQRNNWKKKLDKNQNKRSKLRQSQKSKAKKFWAEEIRANKSDWRKISDYKTVFYLLKLLSDWQEAEARLNLSRFFYISLSCVVCVQASMATLIRSWTSVV